MTTRSTIIKTLVEGETTRMVIPLEEDGAALVGTGLTVEDVLITGRDNRSVDTAGKFGWSVQADGTVYYDPASADFAAQHSPYRVRIKLADGSSKIRYYPNTERAEIVVLPLRG